MSVDCLRDNICRIVSFINLIILANNWLQPY